MKNLVLTEQSILLVANTINETVLKNNEFQNSDKYYKISISDETDVILSGKSKDSHIQTLPFIIIDKCFFDAFCNNYDIISNALLEIQSLVVRYNQNHNLLAYIPSKVFCKNNRIVLHVDKYFIFILVNTNQTGAFFVFNVTTSKKERIEDATPNMELFDSVINSRTTIEDLYKKQKTERNILVEDDIKFDLYFNDEQQRAYSYEDWVKHLSHLQSAFLNKPAEKAIKLRGPAGTGKTLAMELKAIKLLREHPNSRILFTCHSWAVACQVSDFISNLDYEAGTKIDAFPLLALAESKVPIGDYDTLILGDDSYSGKIEQIKILNELILEYQKSDWKLLQAKCSKDFRDQFSSISDTNKNFTWDIMIEITCIIMANGFKPIQTDKEKYLGLERRNWMLPLKSKTEKEIIFKIYEKLIEKLESEGKITSDQIINDYINMLTMFTWFRARKNEGYDYIFVDEMQLFNAQEKAVLQYLTREPQKYPVLIMAMDPKQSVDEVYSEYGVTDVFKGMNPEIEKELGNPVDICLTEAYRYTKQILKFLKHIDSSYPTLDFGEDWNNKIRTVSSNQEDGILPKFYYCKNKHDEIKMAINKAKELSGSTRVAILSLQDDLFTSLIEETKNDCDFKLIDSSSVTHTLKHVRRNVFISKPSYVIGLQFEVIILVGCYSIYNENAPNQSGYKRRFLNDLYLGASRAKKDLYLYSNKEAITIPDVIKTALDNKLVIQK
ncbi:MAG: UvrD-helicase domain-containing protein [Spirochaetaceae bacterium]|nr:UvrD-helicase domain-containing protein [Spirochaetaceae bacterium]